MLSTALFRPGGTTAVLRVDQIFDCESCAGSGARGRDRRGSRRAGLARVAGNRPMQ